MDTKMFSAIQFYWIFTTFESHNAKKCASVLVLMMQHLWHWWLRFAECQILLFFYCRLNQKSMVVVIWRTIHQTMSLTWGTALSRLICLLFLRFTLICWQAQRFMFIRCIDWYTSV